MLLNPPSLTSSSFTLRPTTSSMEFQCQISHFSLLSLSIVVPKKQAQIQFKTKSSNNFMYIKNRQKQYDAMFQIMSSSEEMETCKQVDEEWRQ